MFPENISKNFDSVKEIAFSDLPIEEKMKLFESFDEIEVFCKNVAKTVINCFLPIEGFSDYAVNPFGEVISSKGEFVKLLSKHHGGSGYYDVLLCGNKEKNKYKNIHRLVSETFLMNPENKMQVNHIDGDKENNRLDNLEYCTAKENIQHAHRTGLCSKRGRLTEEELNQIVDMLNSELNHKDIANKFNVSENAIHNIATGRSHSDIYENIEIPENKIKIKVKCIETGKIYASQREAEKELKLYCGNVTRCLQGKISHVNGYHFTRVNEKEI